MQNSQLKIVYNDDCVDLRGGLNPTKRMMLELEPRSAQEARNEIVNSALKKLAKTYHSNTQTNPRWKPRVRERTYDVPLKRKISGGRAGIKSKSELLTAMKKRQKCRNPSSSSPVIQLSGRGDVASQLAPSKNTFTMAKPTRADNQERSKGKTLIKDKSLERLVDQLPTDNSSQEITRNHYWKDQRLIEKYSLLKIPWKRSHTLPLCASKPSMALKQDFLRKLKQQCDKKTYLYDDGTDIDSTMHIDLKTSQVFQARLSPGLNISAHIWALLLIGLVVWFMWGNKLYNLLAPKPPESPFKRYMKYAGGSIFYTISSIIRFIGRILAIPTHQVFQPANDYVWPH
ncbi:uncharacterized protein LOC109545659 isoform X2 [Dendroctonus ponderosae]|nr:uncharacterized protein LOC109545659 isoform X2 [Dendroctonus ponderosae]